MVAPLRNVNASPSLVERIATLLALPWAGVDREESVDEELIIRAYAFKVMVQRRSGDNRSTGNFVVFLSFFSSFLFHVLSAAVDFCE